MGFDMDGWTVQVLEDGRLPPLPADLERGQTAPVAFWRGEQYGAVLFLRRWKNGHMDSDCCISEPLGDGRWGIPFVCGGGNWLDDAITRSTIGWDGDHVAWTGSISDTDYRVAQGAASARITSLQVNHADETWTVPIVSPAGTFLVGIEGGGPATVRALDAAGNVVPYADGETEITV